MTSKSITTLAFAAGCLLALGAMPSANAQALDQSALVTNGPQASAGDFGDWSARQNRIESRRYDRLLETNMAFRTHRARTECGPITLPELRERCLASFRQYEPSTPMYGSTMPRERRMYGSYGTTGYGGGYATTPYSSTLGAGGSEAYHTPTPGVGYPPNPAPNGVGMTPGASGVPHTQIYGYR